MIETINSLEKKGFRIAVFPQMSKGKWYWTGGVYIGDNPKATWIDTDNGLPWASYSSYEEAFNAVVSYCNDEKKSKRSK